MISQKECPTYFIQTVMFAVSFIVGTESWRIISTQTQFIISNWTTMTCPADICRIIHNIKHKIVQPTAIQKEIEAQQDMGIGDDWEREDRYLANVNLENIEIVLLAELMVELSLTHSCGMIK